MRSGFIYLPSSATLIVASANGYNWSSRGTSNRSDGAVSPSGYHLSLSGNGVSPSISDERYYGYPLRCLSTVLDI